MLNHPAPNFEQTFYAWGRLTFRPNVPGTWTILLSVTSQYSESTADPYGEDHETRESDELLALPVPGGPHGYITEYWEGRGTNWNDGKFDLTRTQTDAGQYMFVTFRWDVYTPTGAHRAQPVCQFYLNGWVT